MQTIAIQHKTNSKSHHASPTLRWIKDNYHITGPLFASLVGLFGLSIFFTVLYAQGLGNFAYAIESNPLQFGGLPKAPALLAANTSNNDEDLEQHKQKIQQLTSALIQAAAAFQRAPRSDRHVMLNQLILRAQERKDLLLQIMAIDTETALLSSLPEQGRRTLPSEVQPYLEQEISLEGTFEAEIAEDFEQALSWRTYALLDATGRRYNLFFARREPQLLTGSKIRIRGMKVESSIALPAGDAPALEVTNEVLPGHTVKKAIVILLNFQNDMREPWTVDTIRQHIFGRANQYFNETSFNKLSFEGKVRPDGDVVGWYTIPYNNSPCSDNTWVSAARSAAQANGVDLSNYNHFIYYWPHSSACAFAGKASLGGSTVKLNGSSSMHVVSHELGHNLGLDHANSYRCYDATGKTVTISDNCVSSEYMDPFDVMGNMSPYHVSTYAKGRLNWYTPQNTHDVTTSGTYTVAPFETASTGIQSLRIPKDVDAQGNVTRYYYIEFRQPYGLDSFSSNAPVVNGISVRLAPRYTSLSRTQLLDMTPETAGSFWDAALPVGRVFNDRAKNIAVKTVNVSAAGAVVQVELGSGGCLKANPSVAFVPYSQTGAPGGSLLYTVSVTNNDSAGCGSSTYSVTPTLPAGWSQTPAQTSLTLSPGGISTFTVSIESPGTAARGSYTVTQRATDSESPSYTASASATYVVEVPDTTPPTVQITAPSNGATLPSKGQIQISAKATDDRALSTIQIFFNEQPIRTCMTSPCSHKLNANSIAPGVHTITAIASDAASPPNQATATITVTK